MACRRDNIGPFDPIESVLKPGPRRLARLRDVVIGSVLLLDGGPVVTETTLAMRLWTVLVGAPKSSTDSDETLWARKELWHRRNRRWH